MVKPEQLKVGLLVWWERRSARFSEWSCPCVVTAVTPEKNRFQVRSLDDFKETDPLAIECDPRFDPSSLSEMRICSPREVKTYLRHRKRAFVGDVESREDDLATAKEAAESYTAQADALIGTLT